MRNTYNEPPKLTLDLDLLIWKDIHKILLNKK